MANLRKGIKRKIFEVLDESYFTSSGYAVTFPSEDNVYIHIWFQDNNEYYFIIVKDNGIKELNIRRILQKRYATLIDKGFEYDEMNLEKVQKQYHVGKKPGKYMDIDNLKTDDFDKCLEYLRDWLKTVEEELRSIHPLVGDIEDLRREFNERLEEHIKDKSVHFEANEIESLREMLANLEQKFETELKISKEQLEQVKSELKKLKQDLDVFPKKTWWRTAGNRIINMIDQFASSKEGRQLAVESVKKFLSPGE